MINAFVTLFSQGDALFYILFAIANILFIAEAVVPSFGVLGLGGILTGFGSIVARCFSGAHSTTQIILYIVYILLIFGIVVVITKLINKARLHIKNKGKFAIVDNVKVPLTKEGNLDYSFLLGREGVVVSDLKPSGKIKIGENTFDASASRGYIYSGTQIRVDKVIAQRIIVKKKIEGENKWH